MTQPYPQPQPQQQQQPAPGWYPDPRNPQKTAWWTGAEWALKSPTDKVALHSGIGGFIGAALGSLLFGG
jgi:hypothetical protein